MKIGKAAGEDGITVDFLKERRDIVLEELAKQFSESLRTLKAPIAWENANIIIIHEKGNTKELNNYKPIILVSVVHRLQAVYQGDS